MSKHGEVEEAHIEMSDKESTFSRNGTKQLQNKNSKHDKNRNLLGTIKKEWK